ncbi:MAG: metallophosphoesterase family protein [Candidatus Woesearchaeota archaeon]
MRILASGDIHGDIRLSEKLAQKAVDENVDLVILCGDLTQAEQSTDNIIGPFVKREKKVLIIPGNHETVATTDFLAEVYNITNLHGSAVSYNNVGIFGCGGANIGLFRLEEHEIMKHLEKAHSYVANLTKKIMVTHVHPSESLMSNFTNVFPGSTGVRDAITKFKPEILFCSHVHEAEGIEEMIENTRVINVGKQGKIIDI